MNEHLMKKARIDKKEYRAKIFRAEEALARLTNLRDLGQLGLSKPVEARSELEVDALVQISVLV